jgi:TonB family protein
MSKKFKITAALTAALLFTTTYAGTLRQMPDKLTGFVDTMYESNAAEHRTSNGLRYQIRKTIDGHLRMTIWHEEARGRESITDCRKNEVLLKAVDGQLHRLHASESRLRYCHVSIEASWIKGKFQMRLPLYSYADVDGTFNAANFDVEKLTPPQAEVAERAKMHAKRIEDEQKRTLAMAQIAEEPHHKHLVELISSRIAYDGTEQGNPRADVEVRVKGLGTIASRRILQSSGNKAWDDAVLRAIDKTAHLPLDINKPLPPPVFVFSISVLDWYTQTRTAK